MAKEPYEKVKQIQCFSHLTLCHYGYRNTDKVKLLLCLFSSDLMSLCLSLSLPQNKLICYYVFSYSVHQHHTCGASTHDVRSVSTTETRPQ